MSIYKINNLTCENKSFKFLIKDFIIESGHIYVVVGPNGSGKTTLLNLLSFLIKPYSGDVYFQGERVDYSKREKLLNLRRGIGYLMQNPYLFNLKVEDNISLGLRLRNLPKEIIQTKVEAIINQLGLETLRKKSVYHLSGGEAQKVALARTLVLDSKVFLLDEPTNHLDKDTRYLVEGIIKKLNHNKDKTIIITTHFPQQAHRLSEKIISISDGKIS